MTERKIRISELPESTATEGLYTIGVDAANDSCKVPLGTLLAGAEAKAEAAAQAAQAADSKAVAAAQAAAAAALKADAVPRLGTLSETQEGEGVRITATLMDAGGGGAGEKACTIGAATEAVAGVMTPVQVVSLGKALAGSIGAVTLDQLNAWPRGADDNERKLAALKQIRLADDTSCLGGAPRRAYIVKQGQYTCGFLKVFSDSAGHGVFEVLYSSCQIQDGAVKVSHQDGTLLSYYRFLPVTRAEQGQTLMTWTPWTAMDSGASSAGGATSSEVQALSARLGAVPVLKSAVGEATVGGYIITLNLEDGDGTASNVQARIPVLPATGYANSSGLFGGEWVARLSQCWAAVNSTNGTLYTQVGANITAINELRASVGANETAIAANATAITAGVQEAKDYAVSYAENTARLLWTALPMGRIVESVPAASVIDGTTAPASATLEVVYERGGNRFLAYQAEGQAYYTDWERRALYCGANNQPRAEHVFFDSERNALYISGEDGRLTLVKGSSLRTRDRVKVLLTQALLRDFPEYGGQQDLSGAALCAGSASQEAASVVFDTSRGTFVGAGSGSAYYSNWSGAARYLDFDATLADGTHPPLGGKVFRDTEEDALYFYATDDEQLRPFEDGAIEQLLEE